MKTKAKFLMPAMVSMLMVIACGNSSSKLTSKETQEITAQAQFPDSIKPEEKMQFDFENYSADQLPSRWSESYTGSGGTEWKVRDDMGNKVLAQLYGDNPNSHFNVVVNDGIAATDMALTCRLKGVTGNHDQGGGFVWRFIDKNTTI